MTTADTGTRPDPRWLIGLMSEYRELMDRMAERQRILTIASDPLSGTSAILNAALDASEIPCVAVDARLAGGESDLALSIASAAVSVFAPEATAWWERGDWADSAGLRLGRLAAASGIDLDVLRSGAGKRDQLRRALELLEGLASEPTWLAVDHLDDFLERMRPAGRIELLGVLRAHSQFTGVIHQLLVGRTAGHVATALGDEKHPLYRSGDSVTIRRPLPRHFVNDLAIGRPWIRQPVPMIGAAAELAAGAPAYVWRIVDGTSGLHLSDPRASATDGWRQLRVQIEPATAQQFVLSGSVHRAAPVVLAAIANGLGPYEVELNPKSVSDALTRMRARGQVFSPAKQRWAISDPALASWVREHAPLRIRRRSRGVADGLLS